MLLTLALVLVLALILGMIAHRLHLSPLVGYLLAGIIANCSWLTGLTGVHVNEDLVHDFSQIGVILLLFGVGLQFHLKDLLAVWKIAVPGSCIDMLLWTFGGATLFWAVTGNGFGSGCILFGICVSISSTVVLVRVLSDNKVLPTPAGHTALGWLVVEDIFTIVLLLLLPAFFGGKNESVGQALLGLAWKLPLLVFLIAVVGRRLLTPVLTFVSKEKSGELFTLAVLTVALGIAVVSTQVFGASMEFGAFLSGMVVGQSKFSFRAASDAMPMRDAFAVLFFVSVGFEFSLGGILEHWQLTLATLALVVLFRPLAAFCLISLMGKSCRQSLLVAASLAQIGEFSFIVAGLAASTYNLLPAYASNVVVGVAIAAITINAACYRFVPPLISALEKRGIGGPCAKNASAVSAPEDDVHRIIVVGHGPCGEILTQVLRENNLEVVVIEMNIETVKRLGALGIPAIHGDARLRSIQLMAGVEKARAIIVTSSAAPTQEIVAMARSLNEDIRIMANTTYIRVARCMKDNGQAADRFFAGEAEVALAMLTELLRGLGATEEQVQRERQSTRERLIDPPAPAAVAQA